MREEDFEQQIDEDHPEVIVEQPRGFSMVWLIPIVALLIGAWLAYKTISEMGPTITITFVDGGGLEAGKTKIKYKAVEIGHVESVEISEDLEGVTVTAKLKKNAEPHLSENTKFWVVRPRVGVGGISGLETLVSGAYIGIDPADGPPSRSFVGLEKPPGKLSREEGTEYHLEAERLGSLQPGSPVYFRGIRVGRVLHYDLEADQRVDIHIFIQAPHDRRVHDTSRFWKASGLEVTAGAEGLDVKMESIATLIAGGIAFDTPVTAVGGEAQSKPNTIFKLFENFKNISESKYVRKRPWLLHFDGSVRGLQIGAPVEFRGIKLGEVVDIAAKFDPETLSVRVPVVIELEPERLASLEVVDSQEPYAVAKKMIERGLRAKLEVGSLLTGQLYVDFNFYPDLPKKKLILTGKYPEFPTVPSTMDQFKSTATSLLAQIRQLPLEEIAKQLLGTIKGLNRLTNSPGLGKAVNNLDDTLDEFRRLASHTGRDVEKLAASAEDTLHAARSALEIADPSTPAGANVATTLEELAAAARSIRVLADYLAQHPEALVKGKSE